MTRRSFAKVMAQNAIANEAEVITEALDSMNPSLQMKFKQIIQLMDTSRESNIKVYYQIGKTCKEVQDDPSKYGKDALTNIIKAIHGQKRFIMRCIRFVETYTPQEMQRIVDMRNEKLHFQLCWDHINYALVDYLSKEASTTYLRRAVDAGWSGKEMYQVIQQENPREGRHGRTHKQPTTALEIVQSVLNQLHEFISKDDNVYRTSFYPLLADVTEEDVNEDVLSAINELNSTIDEASKSLRRLKNDISRTKPKFLEILTKKVEQVSPEVKDGFVLNIPDLEEAETPTDSTEELLKQAMQAANM